MFHEDMIALKCFPEMHWGSNFFKRISLIYCLSFLEFHHVLDNGILVNIPLSISVLVFIITATWVQPYITSWCAGVTTHLWLCAKANLQISLHVKPYDRKGPTFIHNWSSKMFTDFSQNGPILHIYKLLLHRCAYLSTLQQSPFWPWHVGAGLGLVLMLRSKSKFPLCRGEGLPGKPSTSSRQRSNNRGWTDTNSSVSGPSPHFIACSATMQEALLTFLIFTLAQC